MDYVEMKDARVRIDDYKVVYRGSLAGKDTLDELQRDYGWEHPESFMGNPVSISDVVAVRKDGEVKSYYVDVYSFVEFSGFVGCRDREMDLYGSSTGAVCEAEVKYPAAREETGPGKRKSVLEALKEKQSKQRGQEDRVGTAAAYYVEKAGFTVIDDFMESESGSSGTSVSIDTVNFHIEGKAGSWLSFDSIRLSGQEFFLMEHETYGKEAAWVVVDKAGRLAVDNVRNGFDTEVKRKLEEYLHSSQPEEEGQEETRQQPETTGKEKL